jgi:sugar phosphate isomerase/epimerase
MIALSTSWKSKDCRDGDALVQAVIDAGFDGIELEYRIEAPLFQQMLPALERSGLKVISIHNYFPIPPKIPHSKGGGDLFLLSHPDREERLEAIKWSTKTIEHANDLEAKAVVLHCGRVEMAHEMEKLRDYFNTGRIDSEEARAFIDLKLEKRDRIKPKYLDSLLFCIGRLIPIAEKQNIILGIENRYHYHELPGPDDFEILFSEFRGGPLGYWHDTGHAHANERLGIIPDGEMLRRYSDHLVGIHLHDAVGLDDHLAPGKGEIDFEDFRPFLKKDMPVVVELRPGTPDLDLADGFRFVRQLMESEHGN